MLSVHHVWLWGSCHKHLQARKTFFIHFSLYFICCKSPNLKINEINVSLQTFVLMNYFVWPSENECGRFKGTDAGFRYEMKFFIKQEAVEVSFACVWSQTALSGGGYWPLFNLVDFMTVTSPDRTQTKVCGLMVTVATVSGEVVLATALTFAAFFSDLSVVVGLIQSFYPSSEWMDVSVTGGAPPSHVWDFLI